MRQNSSVKITKIILKMLCADVFYYLFIIILIYGLYNTVAIGEVNINDLFDFKLVVSLIITFMANKLSIQFSKVLKSKLEDHEKLNTNYDLIISRYPKGANFIKYSNTSESEYKKGRAYTSANRVTDKTGDTYIFPVTLEKQCHDNYFRIDDKQEKYVLPCKVEKKMEDIMGAHRFSKVYNQLNIRLDKYTVHQKEANKKIITLSTSRTTYFDSLVTNRAMDYQWSYNITNRELFSPGPFFETLEESKLSNHLGFNGFIETTDGDVIFILRSKDVSIGKGTIGTSIGASLKTKYALDDNGRFTCAGLKTGIMAEIHDELKINNKYYDFSLGKNIIAIYRDIVEGGKPQLLFYVKVGLTSSDIKDKFKKAMKEINKDKENKMSRLQVDGNKLIFVNKEKLKDIYITPDTLIINKKAYRTMPSTAASLVLLIKYRKEHEESEAVE